MVQQAAPGVVEVGGPDLLAAMRATLTGNAMLLRGANYLPVILCRANALPETDEPIVTGMAEIPPPNPDGTIPPDPAPPGAGGGDGAPGSPGMPFINEDGQFCIVQEDGSIKCTTLYKPKPAEEVNGSLAVHFDGGGSVLLNNTQIYHYLPFDATAQKLVVYTDGTVESDDVIVEVYRTPLSTWAPGDDLPPANKIATVASDNGVPGVGLLDVELNADDTIVFEIPLGSFGNVTKVHASLVVVRR